MSPFRPSKGRLKDRLPLRKSILIVCEGEKTETDYFTDFKITCVKVMDGNGRNNKTLVEFAIEQRKSRQYDDAWCVFDRDSFPKDTINSAIQIAEKNGIRIAASNECFELWYLLHFCFLNDQCTREEYQRRLKKKYLDPIGIQYEKQSLYDALLNQQETAIKHAKKLIEHHGISVNLQKKTLLARYPGLDFVNTKPFTTVHDLVTDLIEESNKIGPIRNNPSPQ